MPEDKLVSDLLAQLALKDAEVARLNAELKKAHINQEKWIMESGIAERALALLKHEIVKAMNALNHTDTITILQKVFDEQPDFTKDVLVNSYHVHPDVVEKVMKLLWKCRQAAIFNPESDNFIIDLLKEMKEPAAAGYKDGDGALFTLQVLEKEERNLGAADICECGHPEASHREDSEDSKCCVDCNSATFWHAFKKRRSG